MEKVLDEIQRAGTERVPEIEKRLEALREAIRNNDYETDDFKQELASLETLLGHSDKDLTLIRLEILANLKQW